MVGQRKILVIGATGQQGGAVARLHSFIKDLSASQRTKFHTLD